MKGVRKAGGQPLLPVAMVPRELRRYVVAMTAAIMMIGLTATLPAGPLPAAATPSAEEIGVGRAQTSSTAGGEPNVALAPLTADPRTAGPPPAAPLAATTPAPVDGPLTPVEAEIVRLTNELRANPAGSLARRRPQPACVADPFYAIAVDADTGLPSAVAPLAVDDAVTRSLARPWAVSLRTTGRFQHRPSDEAHQLYTGIGLPVSAWGENIAWFTGFDPTQAARIHFEGWRESDDGHYCALVSGRFTHLGVGAIQDGGQSWAVQNFYG